MIELDSKIYFQIQLKINFCNKVKNVLFYQIHIKLFDLILTFILMEF